MNWADFGRKKVALLGAGKENISLIPHLQKAGADITLCEQWEKDIPADIKEAVALKTGDDHVKGLDHFDYLFRSPGLPVARIDEALKGATKQPIRTSAMDLFLSLGLGITVGVTGSKGKGTTTTMLATMLQAAGKDVIVAGNIGAVIFDRLTDIKPETIVVLELSSFQLEDIRHSPHIAILLPITPNDHLEPLSDRSPNFHSSVEAYAAAKANITAFQAPTDLLVFAADSPPAVTIGHQTSARTISVGLAAEADLQLDSAGHIQADGQLLLDFTTTGLKGSHIWLDATLALAAARELGVAIESIRTGLKDYQPLPHRLQTVGKINNVAFVNDSYATAPEATQAAIGAFSQPIVWLGGGSTKGADFSDLAATIKNSTVKAVILLGQEAGRLQEALEKVDAKQPIEHVPSLEAAVTAAKRLAEPGDVVLLSPACASKDMFDNAADRGDQFTRYATNGY